MDPNYPSKKKAYKSLPLAPVIPILIILLLDSFDRLIQFGPLHIVGAIILAFYVFVVIEFFTLIIGLPLIKFLWGRIPFSIPICAIAGGLTACLPILLLSLSPLPDQASVGGKVTVVDGQATAQWYWNLGGTLMYCLALGAIGGLSFWWFCRRPDFKDIESDD